METVIVRRWMRNGEKIPYTFGVEKDVPISIFQDDTVEKALSKIALGIHAYHKNRDESAMMPSLDSAPYAWFKKRSLRFQWGDDASNPWDARDVDAADGAKKTLKYKDDELFGLREVNVVFLSDLPLEKQQDPRFFPDVAVKWKPPTFEALTKEAKLLEGIWTKGSTSGESDNVVLTKCRMIARSRTTLFITDLFEKMSATARVPFLQLVEDAHKIMYKVFDRHQIPLALLQSWTTFERIPKVSSIVAMFPMQRSTQWARLCVEHTGQITLTYQADARDNLKWEECLAHAQKVRAWIEPYVDMRVAFTLDDVTVKTEFIVQSVSLKTVSQTLAFVQPVFHVMRMQDGVLEVACKRSRNYRQKLDILDFIQSRVKLGNSLYEILEDLSSLGLTGDDIEFWKSQYLMLEDAKFSGTDTGKPEPSRRKMLSHTGCMIQLSKSSTGFRAYILHAATLEEVQRISQWVKGALLLAVANLPSTSTVTKNAKPTSPKKVEEQQQPEEPVVDNLLNEGDLDDLMFGGALGKEYQRYFNTMLNAADPLFVETPLYSRKCAANNFRQPIVISKKEKEALDKSEYKGSYDNAVLYGSDPANNNWYMCPRIWCPMSRLPLTKEQLDKNDGKCPGPHFEKPMLLYDESYWDSDPKTAKYVGFLKERSPKNFCLPCCFKKPMNKATQEKCMAPVAPLSAPPSAVAKAPETVKPDLKIVATIKEQPSTATTYKEETYIMRAPAPLGNDRYGALPKDLHQLLLPQVAYATCSKSINTTACYVRRGIGIDDDNFMTTLAMAMGLAGGKAELIKVIKTRMDPLMFMSLENGHVLQAFVDRSPINPSHEKGLLKEWQAWMKRWPKYHHLIQDHSNLSRELGIFKAYQNFVQHLISTDPKNPQHFIDLFRRMGVVLVLWKRDGNNSATTVCPYFSDVNALLDANAMEKSNVLMLLQDGPYIEHIEWKARGQNARSLHPVKEVKSVVSLLSKCPPPTEDNRVSDVLSLLRGLRQWMLVMLKDPAAFEAKAVVLRQDMSIYGILTRSNILLLFPMIRVGVLPELLEMWGVKKIMYQDEIQNHSYKVQGVFKTDFLMLANKLQSLGLGIHAGTPTNDATDAVIEATMRIPLSSNTIPPSVLVFEDHEAHSWYDSSKRRNARWDRLRRLVATTLITYYETLVEPLKPRGRADMIFTLMNTFPKIPEKHMLQALLEEMPLHAGKDALQHWVRTAHLEERTRLFFVPDLQHTKRQWMFSQAAVERGFPWGTLESRKAFKPSEQHTPTQSTLWVNDDPKTKPTKVATLLDMKNVGEEKELPSKFSKIRQYSWSKYRIWKSKEYTLDAIDNLIEWVIGRTSFPLSINEVNLAASLLVSRLLSKKEWIQPLLDDNGFIAAWKETMKKKPLKKGVDIWDQYLDKIAEDERKSMWLSQVSKSPKLMLNDAHWYVLSQLLSMNVLVLHRTKYGTADSKVKRADLEDQSLSSYFFAAPATTNWQERPFIILFKEFEPSQSVYYPIVNDKKEFYQESLVQVPDDIKELLKYHVKQRQPLFANN